MLRYVCVYIYIIQPLNKLSLAATLTLCYSSKWQRRDRYCLRHLVLLLYDDEGMFEISLRFQFPSCWFYIIQYYMLSYFVLVSYICIEWATEHHLYNMYKEMCMCVIQSKMTDANMSEAYCSHACVSVI